MNSSRHAERSFRLGFLYVLLAWATFNALSYFVLSEGWGNLLGTNPQAAEAIGFPWVVWREAPGAVSSRIDAARLTANLVVGIGCSVLAGLAAVRLLPVSAAPSATRPTTTKPLKAPRKLQFSLRALLMVAVVEALVFGLMEAVAESRPILLLLIYLLGPAVIIGVAYRLRDVEPLHRTLALTVLVLLFIPAAAALGQTIDGIRDFTKGIFGLFVFWVPQCVLILIVLVGIEKIRTGAKLATNN